MFISSGTTQYYTIWLAATLLAYAGYVALVIAPGRNLFHRMFVFGKRGEWALYAFGSAFSYAVLTILRIVPVDSWLTIVLLLFTLWSVIILCFAIINTHEKTKKSYEADFAQGIVSTGREHYQKMNEMYDTIGILRHDYKYHLNAVSELANSGDIDGIRASLADVQALMPEHDLRYYCSNSVINALLGSYAERCTKGNIRFDVQIAIPETLSIPNYDMCIVLGNLLENAVEACMKKENGRRVELMIKTQGSHLAVIVRNSFGGVIIENGGLPVSEKKDGGFGLRSIQAAAARYDGHILTEWDSDMFTAYVLLKM